MSRLLWDYVACLERWVTIVDTTALPAYIQWQHFSKNIHSNEIFHPNDTVSISLFEE